MRKRTKHSLRACRHGSVGVEQVVAWLVVGAVIIGGFRALGTSMARAIGSSSGGARAAAPSLAFTASAQAAVWTSLEELARWAEDASDPSLFREWVRAVDETRRQGLALLEQNRGFRAPQDLTGAARDAYVALARLEGPESRIWQHTLELAGQIPDVSTAPSVESVAVDASALATSWRARAALMPPPLARRRFFESGESFARIQRIIDTNAWHFWLPSDPASLVGWGRGLAEKWPGFAWLGDEPLEPLLRGAAGVAPIVFGDDALLGFGRALPFAFGMYGDGELVRGGEVFEALSRSRIAMLEAEDSARAMRMMDAAPEARGLLVRTGPGNESARELAASIGAELDENLPVIAGSTRTVARLERLFATAGAQPAIVLIDDLDAFARADGELAPTHERGTLPALVALMDSHPRVLVVGESRDPASITPLLRQRGRFGPYYR